MPMKNVFTALIVFVATTVVLADEKPTPPKTRPKAEKQAADEKKKEPDWQALLGRDSGNNRSYLAYITRWTDELERFRSDPYMSDLFKQVLGTEYSFVGRYQQAL